MSDIKKIIVSYLIAGSALPAVAYPTSYPIAPNRPQPRVSVPIVDTTGLKEPELKVIAALEMAHFRRTFDGDPADKRVKRLELLLAGAGQDGTWHQRVAGLKDLSTRHASSPSRAPSKYGATQSINQLELSINKKTDPKSDITTRLGNLEKKVFGNVFASIPIEQRIARLQKTIGVGSDQDLADGMPGMSGMSGMPGTSGMLGMPGMPGMPGMSGTLRQFGSMPQGFPPGAMINSPFMSPYMMPNEMSSDPNVNQHMSDMFDHLNQQLRQLHRMPQGYGSQVAPRHYSGGEGTYDFSDGLPPIPKDGSLREKPQLPPYMDPNSI